MKNLAFSISILCLLIACKKEGYSQLDIRLEDYSSGFTKPVDISHAKDGRLFIVELDKAFILVNRFRPDRSQSLSAGLCEPSGPRPTT